MTWKERKTQERINRWVKEEREKSKEVKSGFARVRIERKWRRWQEIEEELGRKENKMGEGERGERGGNREESRVNNEESRGEKGNFV